MSAPPCPEMVGVPAGRVRLGVPSCPPRSGLHWVWHNGAEVEIGAFQLSRTHVTNGEYAAFLAATGHPAPRLHREPGFDHPRQPVLAVSWHDALAYCDWLAGATGRPYRLPRDAEYEHAARGGSEGTIFPWGDELDPRRACFGGRAGPCAAGSFAPNGFGLHDMVGNAWTWCAERFEEVSGGVAAINRPTNQDPSGNRVLRGGSYMTCHYLNLWIAYRHEDPADLRHESIGFRVAL